MYYVGSTPWSNDGRLPVTMCSRRKCPESYRNSVTKKLHVRRWFSVGRTAAAAFRQLYRTRVTRRVSTRVRIDYFPLLNSGPYDLVSYGNAVCFYFHSVRTHCYGTSLFGFRVVPDDEKEQKQLYLRWSLFFVQKRVKCTLRCQS